MHHLEGMGLYRQILSYIIFAPNYGPRSLYGYAPQDFHAQARYSVHKKYLAMSCRKYPGATQRCIVV